MLFLYVSFALSAFILVIIIAEVIANHIAIREFKKFNYEE